MVAQAKALTPDAQAIRADLEYMTARWHELPVPAVFEVRAFKENAQPQTARFKPEWMDEAVEWIANLNALDYNTYSTRNPIRADVTGSAKDEDVIAAFFLWADCDDPTAAGNVYRFDGPKWTAAVTTGRTPSVRVHTYWALDVPCTDLAEWRRVQEDIAAHFASDRSVVNPSRIMRIGGTINHPFKRKQDRGYIPELCTINTTYDQPRSPVSLDQMRRAFGARPEPERSQTGADSAPAFNIDTGPRGKTIDELTALVRGASTDGQKHASVRDLAGHLAGTGVKRETCEAIIRNVCPVWDRNVEKLINDAYAWADAQGMGSSRAEQHVAEAAEAAQPFDTTAVTHDELRNLAPRRWLYGRKILRGFCTVVAAPGGMGKSAWMTAVACDIAGGVTTLHDTPHRAMPVWIYNLEDPRDETLRKVAAIDKRKGLTSEALGNLIVHSGRDRALIVAEEVERGVYVAMPDVDLLIEAIKARGIGVLIVDPAVRAHRLPENDNKAIDLMMDQFARIAHEADCGVVLVHHTKKGFVSGEADSFRGASSMTSAARAAFTLQTMSSQEAQDMSISEAERRFYVRVDNAKANLAPPSNRAEWVKLESQPLDNPDEEYPDGDNVQVVEAWTPPDPWAGLGDVMHEILDRINRGYVFEDGTVAPWCAMKNARDRWVVNAVLASFPDGDKSVDQCKAIISYWRETGLVEFRKEYCSVARKEREMVFVTNPEAPENE